MYTNQLVVNLIFMDPVFYPWKPALVPRRASGIVFVPSVSWLHAQRTPVGDQREHNCPEKTPGSVVDVSGRVHAMGKEHRP